MLGNEQLRMNLLIDERQKKQAEAEKALDAERQRAAGLARQVDNLKDLIAKLEGRPRQRLAGSARGRPFGRRCQPRPNLATLKDPGRLAPAVAFASTRGRLPLPVNGVKIREFGVDGSVGGTEKGLSIATRAGAQVTAPCDGWVVYAGPFRSYGQLLILNAGGGYHVLLAGMERISVDLGQFVLTGEPVAVMGSGSQAPRPSQPAPSSPFSMWSSAKTALPSIPAPGGRQTKAKRFADDAQNFSDAPRSGGGCGNDADRDAAAHRLHVGASAKAAAADTYRQLNLFGDVFERVRADYVEKPDDSKLVEAAINGMLTGLDPHSSYMDPKSFRDMQVQTRGEFGGLGIEVTMEDGLVKVVAPIDDTPAAKAGIRANDIITHLDDEAVQGLTLNQAVEKMRGPVNTKIKLTIMRKGAGQADRRHDHARHHPRALGALAHRRRRCRLHPHHPVQRADDRRPEEGDRAIFAAQIGADKLKGYVIDLRNNPGGLLDQAISVSDTFLDHGEIVSTRGRDAEETQRFNARPGDLTKGKPVIVLINGGSASASEIVAGALQDHKRATVVGTRSFGKGSVQTIIPLGAGNGALRLTTARYYTPSGRSIQAKGIVPDIEVLQEVPEEVKAPHRDQGRSVAARPPQGRRRGAERLAVLRSAGSQGRQGAQDRARPDARRPGERGFPAEPEGRRAELSGRHSRTSVPGRPTGRPVAFGRASVSCLGNGGLPAAVLNCARMIREDSGRGGG